MSSALNDLLIAEVEALAPAARVTADGNGTGIDITTYEGKGIILVSAAYVSGTATTLNGKLQHSDDDGSADPYADVTGAAMTQLGASGATKQKIAVAVQELKKYVRWVDDVSASGTPVYDRCVLLVAQKKSYEPT